MEVSAFAGLVSGKAGNGFQFRCAVCIPYSETAIRKALPATGNSADSAVIIGFIQFIPMALALDRRWLPAALTVYAGNILFAAFMRRKRKKLFDWESGFIFDKNREKNAVMLEERRTQERKIIRKRA